MFAIKDIQYGEELTFDYCSFTDEKSEYDKADCLCASKNCRGKYLHFSKNQESLRYLNIQHCFLHRNYLLLRSTYEEFEEKDREFLYKYNIKEAILSSCPNWLKKWMALIVKLIEEENNQLFKSEYEQYLMKK